MASGAATPEGDLRLAALPFDRRRNGMIIGMGAAGLVVESEDAVRERGMQAICEVLSTSIANSAYHGTRLNVDHVSQVMETLLTTAEQRFNICRDQFASEMMFVSHETYTPARGGSAAAEIHALRNAFGGQANQVIIANTKGFTGHTMGVGIEDVVAVKALQFGMVPPIANIQDGFEPDPELGDLNLSHGGKYPIEYSLRLGAGFGSQIAMTLLHKIPARAEGVNTSSYNKWLKDISGYAEAELETTQRTLRIKDQGVPAQKPVASRWEYGTGPTLWAARDQASLRLPTAAPKPVEPLAGTASLPSEPIAVSGAPKPDYEEIKAYLLVLVSEKTGYPTDVLDLELDLEADLGVDTVKQAELFASIREHYGIPRREDLRLTDYNTLAKVIGFVDESFGVLTASTTAPEPQPVAEQAAPVEVPGLTASVPSQGAPASANAEEIKAYVLSAVSQKTGYPPEVLDLELDLEADLGVDTVKQAELFAAIREQYNIPRREDLRLSDYNTLAKVIGFIQDSLAQMGLPESDPQAVVIPAAVQPEPPSVDQSDRPENTTAPVGAAYAEIKTYLLSAVSQKTGYPTEVLDLDLDLEADLGVDTVKQAELFATIREQYGIPRREDLRLSDYNTLAKVIGFVQDSLGMLTTETNAEVKGQPVSAVPAAAIKVEIPTGPAAEPALSDTSKQPSTTASDSEDDFDGIKAYLLSIVSEKTGYPSEVLDLDLDLEADLGVDTVKQAELFAAIREHYEIPRREDLRLSDYNTLAKVIAFVQTERLALKQAFVPEPVGASTPAIEPEQAVAQMENIIIRRAPVPVLRPRLDLCIPTGVELGEGQRVLLVETKLKTGDALARKLSARKVEVLRLSARLNLDEINHKLNGYLAGGPIHGIYFLPSLEAEPGLKDMNAKDWQSGLDERLYSLVTIMKALPEGTFLVCATRLGGLHGYSTEGALNPLGGATSGLAKAISRERESAFVKVVDFEKDTDPAIIADRLIEETLQDPGVLEVGWENDLRYGIATLEQALPAENNFTLEQGSVFLVSGGSGGIIRPIVEDLVRATHGTFYLLDIMPLPDRDDPDIVRFAHDRGGLKNDLIARLTKDGKKPTPVQVEKALFGIDRSATTLQTLDIIEQLGGKATYLACDVTDPEMIDQAMQQIKQAEGHIDAFLHAAGMERSRKLEMKPIEEFRLVVSVKADGFFNLFKSMEAKGILPRGMVAFSSVAGRFGNSGQTDYAAANDLLCKLTSAIRNQYPALKAVAIDWSAWGGVGMATRGNIPTLMKMAGIDLVPYQQAAPMVRLELLGSTGEAIIAGSLGALFEERCPNGGLDLQKADDALRAGKPLHTMLSHIADYDLNRGLTLEADLDPKTQPFLYDHSLNGIPVLPGVMGIEGFSVAAKHIGSVLASGKFGLEVTKLEDIQFLAAFKFYRKEPRRVTWIARAVREKAGLVVSVTLESSRTLKTGSERHMQHFSGKVYLKLQESQVQEASAKAPKWNGNYTVKAEDIYRLYFHGPAFQVLEGVQRSGDAVIGKLNKKLPSITSDEHALLSTPTLVELCFQTAGIWEIGKTGAMALPKSVESLTLYRQSVNGAAIYAEVKPAHTRSGELYFDARVVNSKGRLYLELKDYRTSSIPTRVESSLLAPLQELMKNS